ncbi:alpha/beta hydrolase [Pseudoxanthomonas dokdonensis]|uniref:Alpha/beta hydrolase n=1 Tax=Pseudoxanthomonas dokdonensis TaxID=344882 RepID=A0A0R0CRH3_9GAMM|nr:alpha/beta fold hydrolase [Pseudoxanthomonas dokdonensis]KRG68273.1 alpha/beta hydrolase [Pseudoxanthomonas dokdonensis]
MVNPARPHPAFPDTSAALTLPGPAGKLEVQVELPDDDVTALPLVAVVCHPLPTEGGTMHNKVVVMAARSLRELGATTVRFNFRGTGESEGVFDHGDGESEDLRAVVEWVRAQRPGTRLWLAGFSFGAYVSLRNAAALQADALISIAPPAGRWDFDGIVAPTSPWLLIQGEQDEVVSPQAVYDWVDSLKQPPEVIRMPDTSHFFHRKLMDLRGAIKHAMKAHLPAA